MTPRKAIDLMVNESPNAHLSQRVENIRVEVATVLAKKDDYSPEVLLAIGWCNDLLTHITTLDRKQATGEGGE